MPKAKKVGGDAGRGARAVPWAVLLRVAVVVNERWRRLSESEREKLGKLIRRSKGRPSNLSAKEREQIVRLVRKLDPLGVGRELFPLPGSSKRGPRKR